MRVLIDASGTPVGDEVTDAELLRLYDVPGERWLRANMVSTVDGAATGGDGVTASINNPPDKRVFHLLRSLSDAILVGAGSARAEAYRPAVRPLVLVSRSGMVPPSLRDVQPGRVLMAACAASPGLTGARAALGDGNVLVMGKDSVDLGRLTAELAERGLGRLLCEGGPTLLTGLLAAGLVDELCTTQVPQVAGGTQGRITAGAAVDHPLDLGLLLEEDGTLLARWHVRQ